MPVLQLLCFQPKPRQTRAFTPHCLPPLPTLLNSTPTPSVLGRRKTPNPPAEDAELTISSFALCLPHSALSSIHTHSHLQSNFACVDARVQQERSICNVPLRLLHKGCDCEIAHFTSIRFF